MPFVRIVERNPNLPHQIYLTVSQDQHDYIISCQCMPASGAGREEIARVTFKEIAESNGRGSAMVLRAWKKARHNPLVPALDDASIAESLATRWVWVDLGAGSGAEDAELP
jgi:hypothetical protein